MAHRRVSVFDLAQLAKSTLQDDKNGELAPKSARESALKFMTRSVACMADGKGEFDLASAERLSTGMLSPSYQGCEMLVQFLSLDGKQCSPRWPASSSSSALCFSFSPPLVASADSTGWASGSIEGRIAVEYFDSSAEAQAGKYAFRAHRHTVDGVDCVYPINALAYHPM